LEPVAAEEHANIQVRSHEELERVGRESDRRGICQLTGCAEVIKPLGRSWFIF